MLKTVFYYFINVMFLISSWIVLDVLQHPYSPPVIFSAVSTWFIYAILTLGAHLDACLGEKPELPENTKIKSETDSPERSDKK